MDYPLNENDYDRISVFFLTNKRQFAKNSC